MHRIYSNAVVNYKNITALISYSHNFNPGNFKTN